MLIGIEDLPAEIGKQFLEGSVSIGKCIDVVDDVRTAVWKQRGAWQFEVHDEVEEAVANGFAATQVALVESAGDQLATVGGG